MWEKFQPLFPSRFSAFKVGDQEQMAVSWLVFLLQLISVGTFGFPAIEMKSNCNQTEKDIREPAYAKSFAKTTGTKSPDGHVAIQPKWQNFERNRWTVTGQWFEVTRPSANCQTTFLYLSYVAYVNNGELVSLIGNQRVGIFPLKSKILFHLFLALIWGWNFQDWTIPVGWDTWPNLKKKNLFPS